MLSWLTNLILTIIFPPYCAGCHHLGSFLCGKCYDKIEFQALPLRLKLEPLFIDGITSSANYHYPIPQLLHLMKYNNVKAIAPFLGQFLFDTTFFPKVECVSCVPIHKKRLQERGFNQSELMAQEFARQAGIPYLPLLIKHKHTTAQAKSKTKQQRQYNLDQVFIPNPALRNKLPRAPTSVLLLDDVCTTGTTLNQCAKVLKSVGVSQVYGLVVAHGK